MQKVFVTGGSGFVGRNLLAVLRERGVAAVALARSAAAEEAVRAAGAAEVVRGDLDDEAALAQGCQGCDVAFHSAATVTDWGRLEDFERINVAGTRRVLEAARAAGVPRVVHVSTEAVLVDGRPLVDADETWPLPRKPIGVYPRTKGRAEQVVLAANGPELTTVIVRPRLIWGRGDTSVLPQLVEAVRSGSFRWIAGGRYPTSTCHVANVCEGLLLAAERGGPGEIYFLTDGEPVQAREFLTALLASQGITPPDRSIPRWLALAVAGVGEVLWRGLRLRGKPPITRAAVHLIGEPVTVRDDKARRELGYQGRVSVDQGLAEMSGGEAGT